MLEIILNKGVMMSDKLINVILDDAQKIATSTRNEGSEKAQEIINRASFDVTVSKQKAYEETNLIREDILKQAIVDANLDVKKLILATKRGILDVAFNDAMKKLLNLPKQEYLKIISSLLNNSEDGDTVLISLKDKSVITKDFIANESKRLGKKIVLSNQYIDILGGVILSNENFDKNFSFEVLMLNLRN
jgi:V/A-type H+-transporting ATPase subunit E